MENPMAAQVHFSEYQRRAAWVNANDWQFERVDKRYRVRTAVAMALVTLANLLTPTRKQGTQSA
jgi:hypothetical protein